MSICCCIEGRKPSCDDEGEGEDEMRGGVGLEDVDRAGDNEVDRCRSGFDGVVGTGGVGFRAVETFVLASLDLRVEPFVLPHDPPPDSSA